MAQSCHVTFLFYKEHPFITNEWMNNSNYIAVLNCPNENQLFNIIEKAKSQNIKISIFQEPDIGNQITAIALEPSIKSKKICSNLKLALSK